MTTGSVVNSPIFADNYEWQVIVGGATWVACSGVVVGSPGVGTISGHGAVEVGDLLSRLGAAGTYYLRRTSTRVQNAWQRTMEDYLGMSV